MSNATGRGQQVKATAKQRHRHGQEVQAIKKRNKQSAACETQVKATAEADGSESQEVQRTAPAGEQATEQTEDMM